MQAGEPPEPVSYADVQARFFGPREQGRHQLADADVQEALTKLLRELKTRQAPRDGRGAVRARRHEDHGERTSLIDARGDILCTWRASAAPMRFRFRASRPRTRTCTRSS